MQKIRKSVTGRLSCCVTILLAGWLALSALSLAQQPGNKAVENSSATSATSSTVYIDASVITGTGSNSDICALINAALGLIGTTGYGTSTVIDARGIPASSLTCTGTNTPWSYSSTTRNVGATILLPAGNITVGATWVLPNGTHLVGEGSGSVTGGTTVTTIQTSSTLNPMIQMGTSSGSLACPTAGCTAISIEDLNLNGQGDATAGILNSNSLEQSYVKGVGLYQIDGTGLSITNGAANSGPYTDITFGTGSATSSTVCASISSVSTRGIHGLHCTNSGTVPSSGAAVLLNGSGNSLEDVTIQGFYDGVEIGSSGTAAQGNVLLNIAAVPWTSTPTVKNAVVHVMSTTGVTVSDIAIMGVNKGNASTTCSCYSIQDNVTASSSVGSVIKLLDTSVGLYAFGDKATITGASKAYPRYTTSPNLPTWVRGNGTPGSSCAIGSLYSNTGGTGPKTDFYVCTAANTWTGID